MPPVRTVDALARPAHIIRTLNYRSRCLTILDTFRIDGVVYTGGISCLIECKDWSQRASIEPIAKMRNQLLRRPSAAIGAIVSIKGFTEAAEILARFLAPQTILLWNGNELAFALRNQMLCESLEAKYRYCIETGKPDFNLLLEKVP